MRLKLTVETPAGCRATIWLQPIAASCWQWQAAASWPRRGIGQCGASCADGAAHPTPAAAMEAALLAAARQLANRLPPNLQPAAASLAHAGWAQPLTRANCPPTPKQGGPHQC